MSVFDLAVQFMVPMAIQELREMSSSDRDRMLQEWASQQAADIVAGSGDNIQHGAVKRAAKPDRKEAGQALSTFAKAVAAAAHLPGGVQLFGMTWCANHAWLGVRADTCTSCEATGGAPR